MKIKDLIFEAPVPPTTPPAPKPPGIQKPVGNVPASGVRAAGAPIAGQTQQTPGIAAPGTTPQTNQPVPPNQQMGQNPTAPGQTPLVAGQPVAPGQQPLTQQDQLAQQLAQQTATIATDLDKTKTVMQTPGVNVDTKKLAAGLATQQLNPKAPPNPQTSAELAKAAAVPMGQILANPKATAQFQTALNTAKQPVK
jgi:hypothetical protein